MTDSECLSCHHPDPWHVRIPAEDDEKGQSEVQYFSGLAMSHKGRDRIDTAFTFVNRPCTVSAITDVCLCMDYYDTPEMLAAFKKAEANGYREDDNHDSPERQARDALKMRAYVARQIEEGQ